MLQKLLAALSHTLSVCFLFPKNEWDGTGWDGARRVFSSVHISSRALRYGREMNIGVNQVKTKGLDTTTVGSIGRVDEGMRTYPLLVLLERLPPEALHAGREALLHEVVVHAQAASFDIKDESKERWKEGRNPVVIGNDETTSAFAHIATRRERTRSTRRQRLMIIFSWAENIRHPPIARLHALDHRHHSLLVLLGEALQL